MKKDAVDKLVVFLANRDGIDKLVKTLQYVSKLISWRLDGPLPDHARRAKYLESAAGLSRKAFRLGRFLSGFNALRKFNPDETHFLGVLANAGEMVYFLFDHFLWLSRVGVLDPAKAKKFSFVSAFGECFAYVFFTVLEVMAIWDGFIVMKTCEEEERKLVARNERAMRVAAVAANLADLVIAVAEVEPNRVCNHGVSLAVSGLVSAWGGWYRNWPSS